MRYYPPIPLATSRVQGTCYCSANPARRRLGASSKGSAPCPSPTLRWEPRKKGRRPDTSSITTGECWGRDKRPMARASHRSHSGMEDVRAGVDQALLARCPHRRGHRRGSSRPPLRVVVAERLPDRLRDRGGRAPAEALRVRLRPSGPPADQRGSSVRAHGPGAVLGRLSAGYGRGRQCGC
jgi:hypothetical protein